MASRTEMVIFPDASKEPKMMVDKYFVLLMDMGMSNPGLLRELLKKCRDDNHQLSPIDKLLVKMNFPILESEVIHPAIKKIILALVTEEGESITVSNPFS